MRQTDTTPDAKRAHWVYIVDEYSEDKTSSDADALCVYSINYDSTNLTCYEDLVKGKKITVKGFLENYKSGSKLQPEVTYKGDVSVECVYLEKVEKTDAEKVAAAKAAVTLESTYTAGEVTLPATSNGASLSWAVTSGTNVTIDGTKMTITEPSADVDVKITVTISSGDVHEDKVIDIKVAKASTKGTLEDPYTAAEAKAIAEGLTAGAYLTENGNPKQVYVQGYITVLGSWDATNKRYGNSYIADDASASQANSLLVWSISAKDGSALENDGDIAQGDLVVLSGFIQNHSKSGAEISYSGSDNVNIVSKGPDNRTPEEKAQAALDKFTLADGATVTGNITVPEGVTISSDNTAVIDNTGKVNRPAEADGNATVTLTVSATVDGATKTKTVTVTVKALSTAVGQSASLAFSTATNTKNAADQMIFAKDGMTVTFDKGTATVDANNGNYLGADGNAAQLRAYQGGIVTIAFNGINKIVFTVDTYKNTYPTDLEATIKAAYPDATVTIDGVKVTVEFASAENEISFTMTKQVRMKSIDINPAD
ncbi:MAG: hypothetical protein K2N23_04030 [Clostridia bacterium]|nr:hypothetical protein [Clostridia bacterium]